MGIASLNPSYAATPCWTPTAKAAARRQNLRRFFEIDRRYVAQAAITAAEGKMTAKDVARAIKLYKIDAEKPNSLHV